MVEIASKNIANRVKMAVSVSDTGRPKARPNKMNRGHNPIQEAMYEMIQNKLVRPSGPYIGADSAALDKVLDSHNAYFKNVSDDTMLSIEDAESILDALPDLGLAKKIIISSIVSPNDMISKEILYRCDTKVFGEVTSVLLDVIRDYFNGDYKIKNKLSKMLDDSLFMTGAYISVILPESSVDEAINSNLVINTESMSKLSASTESNLGLITLSNEEQQKMKNLFGVSISDNFDVIKMPKLKQKQTQDKISSILSKRTKLNTSIETALVSSPDSESDDDFYPTRDKNRLNVLHMKSLRDLDKQTVGHPLQIIVPTEAFIPIYVPGDPSNHKGGFILLDKSGNPVQASDGDNQTADLQAGFQASIKELSSGLIAASSDSFMSVSPEQSSGDVVDDAYVSKLYSILLEKSLKEQLSRDSVFDEDLDIGFSNDVMRVMYQRALQKLETRLVFVPKELFSYLAFDYKKNGVGRSLLDRTKTVSSLRMVQELADALANIRNAIDHKEVTFSIDPDDPDPIDTVTKMLHQVQHSMRAKNPLGLFNYNDISRAFETHGWNVKTQNHEGMPEMGVEYSMDNRNYSKPDSDYADRLRNQQVMGMGVAPDLLSGITDPEFATNIITSNIFLSQDTMERQQVFGRFLSDMIKMYTRNSSILMTKLVNIIEKNRDQIVVKDPEVYTPQVLAVLFVNNITIDLPTPDQARIEKQKQALSDYADVVDQALEFLIDTEVLSRDTLGEKLGEQVEMVKKVFKNHAMRTYMTNNNIATELFKMIFTDTDQISQMDLLQITQLYLDSLRPQLRDFVASNMNRSIHADKVMEKIEERLQGEEPADDYGGGLSDDSDSDDGDDNLEGDDDSGDDMDFGDEGEEDLGDDTSDDDSSDDSGDDDLDFNF